jgi:hypothetical protein
MNKLVSLIILLGLIFIGNVQAQKSNVNEPKPLFQSEEMLNLRLEADFTTVFSVTDDSTYFPAKISMADNNGKIKDIKLKTRTRGHARRDEDVCKFSPLRLRFPKKETSNTVFDEQRTIKLVTHCQKANANEQYIILEYLIYKAFNILTDSSFKVRQAKIVYVYSNSKKGPIEKFAFFIEKDKHLAKRLNAIELESIKIHPMRLNATHACLMDMFQYMIGNLDYSAYKKHNIKLMGDSNHESPPIAIPYDFDLCGLVLPNYAVPHPQFNLEKVTDRLYRRFKKDPEIVYQTIKIFNNKKADIYQLFENSELLNKKVKKRVIKYLDEFYNIINDEQLVKVVFIEKARVMHN